jgi:hypothetical protein
MKKLVYLFVAILAVLAMLSLASCGGEKNLDPDEENTSLKYQGVNLVGDWLVLNATKTYAPESIYCNIDKSGNFTIYQYLNSLNGNGNGFDSDERIVGVYKDKFDKGNIGKVSLEGNSLIFKEEANGKTYETIWLIEKIDGNWLKATCQRDDWSDWSNWSEGDVRLFMRIKEFRYTL